MSNGIVSSRRWLILLAMTVVTGCNTGLEQQSGSTTGRPVKASSQLLKMYSEDQRNALRTRTDTARGRVWVLSIDGHVRVYDDLSKRLLRQVALPDWLVVKTPCMPDLILDGSGSAFVSSNVTPSIWRINADTFEVRVPKLSMRGREHWDFGFATLAFDGKGTLYGLSPSADSLWKIDVTRADANMIASYRPSLEECAFTAQSLDRLETNR